METKKANLGEPTETLVIIRLVVRDRPDLIHMFNEMPVYKQPTIFSGELGNFVGIPVEFDQNQPPRTIRAVHDDGSETLIHQG